MAKIRIKAVPKMQTGGYAPLTSQERDAWERMQSAAYQQGFYGDQHSKQPGIDFMRQHGVDPNRLAAYQQDFLDRRSQVALKGQPMVRATHGNFSPADAHYGKDTSGQRDLTFGINHNGVYTSYGTDYDKFLQANNAIPNPSDGWENYGKVQSTSTTNLINPAYFAQSAPQATPKPTGFPKREDAIAKYKAKKAAGNVDNSPEMKYSFDTGKADEYEYAHGGATRKIRITGIPTMANGGYANRSASHGYGNQQVGQGYALNRFWSSPAGYPGSTSQVNPYGRTGNTLPEAENGGDINAEKQEMILGDFDQDGQQELMNVDGPPHTEGGKDVNVPSNSFVFSDTKDLKIKDPQILAMFAMAPKRGGYTPAFIAKKYDLNKLKKILDDPNADELSKKTAQLMYDNYLSKLNRLAGVQEQMKAEMGMEHHDPEMGQVPAQEPPVQEAGNMGPGGENMMQPEVMFRYGGIPQYQTGGASDPLMDKVLSGNATVAEIEEYNQKYNAQADEQLGTNYVSNIDPSVARASGIGYTNGLNSSIGSTTSQMPHYAVPYNQPAIRSTPQRRGILDKTGAIISNPFTAASYVLNNQPLPDYFERHNRNIYDNATDVFDPLVLAAGVGKMPIAFGKALSIYNAANAIGNLPNNQAIVNNVQVPQNRTSATSSPVATVPVNNNVQSFRLPQLPSSANNQNANQQVAQTVPAPYKLKSPGKYEPSDYAPWDSRVGEQQGYPANAPQTTLDYQKWANMRGAKLKEDDKMGIKTIGWENPAIGINPLETNNGAYGSNVNISTAVPSEVRVPTMAELAAVIPKEEEEDKKKRRRDGKQRRGFSMNPNFYGDAMNIAQMAQLRKFVPYEAVPQAVIPETVFMDPTRAIAAQQESARNAMEMAGQGADSRAARAMSLAYQGEAGKQAADVIGQYANQNVGIANTANANAAQITNQLMQMEGNRMSELNKGNFLAARDYQREMGKLQAEWADRKQKQHDTAVKTAWLNKTSPYFDIDPYSQMPVFKNKDAETAYWKEIKGAPDTTVADRVKSLMDKGYTIDNAIKLIELERGQSTLRHKDPVTGDIETTKGKKYGGMMRYGGSHMAMPNMAPAYQIGGSFVPLAAGPDLPMPAIDNTAYNMPTQPVQQAMSYSDTNPVEGMGSKKASKRDIASITNNPGNIIYTPKFGKLFGAMDSGIKQTDGKGHFAMFPDLTTGLKAYQTQLFGEVDGTMKSNYYKKDTTVDQALKTWSNKGYSGDIYPEVKNKTLGELTMAERNELAKRQIKHESGDMYKLLRQRGVFKYGGSALQKFIR